MQVNRTEALEGTAEDGSPILRVILHGEAGERITIDMAGVEGVGPDDEAALLRARAMLVQAATFDLPVSAYDANSNGNFDELTVTEPTGDDGPSTYIFEYRDGYGARQLPPAEMPSLKIARKEAVRCASDLLVDLQPGADRLEGWLVRVRADNGEILCSIDVQEAESAKQAMEN